MENVIIFKLNYAWKFKNYCSPHQHKTHATSVTASTNDTPE